MLVILKKKYESETTVARVAAYKKKKSARNIRPKRSPGVRVSRSVQK